MWLLHYSLHLNVSEVCSRLFPLSQSRFKSARYSYHRLCCCRFWVTERRIYQERLAEEQKAAQDLSGLEAQLTDKTAAIKAAKDRILALRSQVLQGEEQINKLLHMVVAGTR